MAFEFRSSAVILAPIRCRSASISAKHPRCHSPRDMLVPGHHPVSVYLTLTHLP